MLIELEFETDGGDGGFMPLFAVTFVVTGGEAVEEGVDTELKQSLRSWRSDSDSPIVGSWAA